MAFDITADSKPVLDGWGWADYWTKEDWLIWVKVNVKKYGKKIAKDRFLNEWKRQSVDANPYNWAKYDADFVGYLKTIDVDVSSTVSAIFVGSDKAVKGAANAVGKVGDIVGDGISKKTKIIIGVSIALVLVIAGIVVYVKYFKK